MPGNQDPIIIGNGELKLWWNKWIRYYDVILINENPYIGAVKLRAWILLLIPVVLAFGLGAVIF